MKRIILGKLYNTETAKCLGVYDNGYNRGDFGHMRETLYRKRNGEFFLYGYGGPMTQYRVPCGNNGWSGSEMIIPYTEERAMEWAEENLDVDEYVKIFGEVEE